MRAQLARQRPDRHDVAVSTSPGNDHRLEHAITERDRHSHGGYPRRTTVID